MSNLKDEILGEMIKADNNGTIHSSNYGMLAEIILSLVEKRIDEWMNYTLPEHDNNLKINEKKNLMYYRLAINDVKELLK